MAKQVIWEWTDDLDGSAVPGIKTVSFAMESSTYEIDLSPKNHEALREALAPFIAAGVKVRPTLVRQVRRPANTPVAGANGDMFSHAGPAAPKVRIDPAQMKKIREWARANGYQIGNSGKIPQRILDAWYKAMPPVK